MYSKITCQHCKKTIKCHSITHFEKHLIRCKAVNSNTHHFIDNNNIFNDDTMSITSDTNDSVLSLTNTLYSLDNNNDYNSDTDEVSYTTNPDIISTMNSLESFEEMSCDEDNISLPSIDTLELEEVIDYSLLKQSDTNCDSSMLLDPFEAKLLQLFVNNSIPITLFQQFTKLFQYGVDSDYNPKKAPSYQQLIEKLKSIEELKRHQYSTKQFIVDDTSHLIRVFPFLDNVKWLLTQEEFMSKGLFKYDSKSDCYSELNTGYWWKTAERKMLDRTKFVVTSTGSKHILVPIILFIDKTHCSSNGTLNAEPVMATIGNIPLELRKNHKSWFNLGFLPQKILTPAERDEIKNKGGGTRSLLTNIYHEALSTLLEEFVSLQQQDYANNMGTPVFIHGVGNVNAHFELSLVIGDMVGHDQLCCHYQCYSKEIHRPMRMCYCSYDDLDNPLIRCDKIIAEKVDKIVSDCIEVICADDGRIQKARDLAKEHSQELYLSAFHKCKFGGDIEGIYGATPVETLHALLLGVVQYVLKSLYQYSVEEEVTNSKGKKKTVIKKKFALAEFEKRIRLLSSMAKRQSDRNWPRSTFTKGVSTLAGISGQEYIGLSVLTLVALPGCIDIDDVEERLMVEEQFSELLWLGVSLYETFNSDSILKSDLKDIDAKVRYYIDLFCEVCGDQRRLQSEVGTKLPKLHSLIHLVHAIEKYGVPNNFFGGYLESMLKVFVKHPCERTRKMLGDLFLLDMCNRWSEFRLINDYMDMYLSPMEEEEKKKEDNESEHEETYDDWIIGSPKFTFELVQNQWQTVFRNKYGCIVNENEIFHPFYDLEDDILHVLKTWITVTVPTLADGQIPTIKCHHHIKYKYDPKNNSGANITEIYRCSPCYRNKEWFDWVEVKYLNKHDSSRSSPVPARTYLWLQLCYEDIAIDDHVFLLAKPLTQYSTPSYRLLDCLGCDTLNNTARIFEGNEVIGPISVFPAVNVKWNGDHNKNDERKQYLDESSKYNSNSKYIVIPSRNEWKNMGWNRKKYKKFLMKLGKT